MNIKTTARVAAVVASALVAVACTTPAVSPPAVAPAPVAPNEDGTTTPVAPAGVEQIVNISAVEGITNTNNLLPWGNSSHNANILFLTNDSSFQFFDENLNTVRNTDFGHFTAETAPFNADGTLDVSYTINEGVTWSDGVPVDAADMILFWGTQNRRFNSISEEDYDAQLEAAGAEGYIPLADDQVFFPGGSTGMTDVKAFPVISDDGRTISFQFGNPRADWFFQFGVSPVAAHVVGRLAFGIEDPMEAKQAVISAFGGPENYRAQDGTEVPTVETTFSKIDDPAGESAERVPGTLTTFTTPDKHAIYQIAEVWSTAFDVTGGLPADPGVFLSRIPFVMAEIQDGQFIRLERNPHFTAYGNVVPRPTMDEITVRIIPDAMAQAQALSNDEVQIINPTTSADIVNFVDGLPGVDVAGTTEGVYEHVTLIQNNNGPFDPAYWAEQGVANPEEAARAVRVAFLQTIPRQQIIDLLIEPAAPGAVSRGSWLLLPGSPGYADSVANSGIQDIDAATPEQTRQLLLDAGIPESALPINVRLLYAIQNPRRVQQFQIIENAAQQGGNFNVVDGGDELWGQTLRQNTGAFDAALFAWAATSTAFLNAESNTFTGGFNNIGGFSDPRVDELWLEARQETNPTRIAAIAGEIDKILIEDGFGIPLFQHPGLLAWRSDVQNVSSIAVAPTIHWNFFDWMRAAEN